MGSKANGPRITVSSQRSQFDEPVDITVSGFEPTRDMTVRARMELPSGTWRSWATFETDTDGTADLSAQAPTAGTYRGVDPTGLLWSMELVTDGQSDELKTEPARSTVVELIGEQDGERLTTTEFTRVFATEDEVQIALPDSINAHLYEPTSDGPHPTILLLGGSDGGFPDWKRPLLLARRGYAVVALAYFGIEGLPNSLEEIPLSYFRGAIEWIDKTESLSSEPIAAIGSSRGAELALLLGSRDHRIRTVIGYAPSAYVYQGVPENGASAKSAWCHDGESLSYIPYKHGPTLLGRLLWNRLRRTPISLRSLYDDGLRSVDDERRDLATIPVERIGGPVLVISGGDDDVWPAGKYTAEITSRLEADTYDHPYERIHFPENGHKFVVPYAPATELTGFQLVSKVPLSMGGTPAACHEASLVAWERTLEFLECGFSRNVG